MRLAPSSRISVETSPSASPLSNASVDCVQGFLILSVSSLLLVCGWAIWIKPYFTLRRRISRCGGVLLLPGISGERELNHFDVRRELLLEHHSPALQGIPRPHAGTSDCQRLRLHQRDERGR